KTQPATGETYPKSDLFNKALDILRRIINKYPDCRIVTYPCEVSIKATNNPTTSEIFEVNYPFLLTLQKMRESKVFFFLYFHLYVFFYML
ncbi:hypothetical protein ABW48_19560, partial [Pluralibacter gergoviae]